MNLPFDMRKTYLDRRFEELNVLKKNINSPDFSLLKKWGHQIKGNAKSFNFDDLTQVAIEFEKIAESKKVDDLLSAMTSFEQCLNLCAQRLSLEQPVTDK